MLALPGPVWGQSLGEAQQSALGESWVLRSDTSRQEATEARLLATVDQFLPTVSAFGEHAFASKISTSPNPVPAPGTLDTTARRQPDRHGIVASLPLFDGFERWNNMLSAKSLVEAGRRQSMDVRQQILLETATAYLAVIRTGKIVALRRQQVASIERIAKGAATQLALKDATRTDVALAVSRVQDAQSALDQALADETVARLDLQRLTQTPQGRTSAPQLPPGLPRSEAEIVELVRLENPRLAAARYEAEASSHLAAATKGALLPRLSMQLSYTRQDDVSQSVTHVTDMTAKLIANIPIYQPGTIPRINEAYALSQQKWHGLENDIRQTVTAAKIVLQRRRAATLQVSTLAARSKALRGLVRGYEIERRAGYRTIIDELNGRSELAQAEAALAASESERDRLAFEMAALLNRLSPTPGPTAWTPVGPRDAPPPPPPLAGPLDLQPRHASPSSARRVASSQR